MQNVVNRLSAVARPLQAQDRTRTPERTVKLKYR